MATEPTTERIDHPLGTTRRYVHLSRDGIGRAVRSVPPIGSNHFEGVSNPGLAGQCPASNTGLDRQRRTTSEAGRGGTPRRGSILLPRLRRGVARFLRAVNGSGRDKVAIS